MYNLGSPHNYNHTNVAELGRLNIGIERAISSQYPFRLWEGMPLFQ